jgi:hypothetical protein
MIQALCRRQRAATALWPSAAGSAHSVASWTAHPMFRPLAWVFHTDVRLRVTRLQITRVTKKNNTTRIPSYHPRNTSYCVLHHLCVAFVAGEYSGPFGARARTGALKPGAWG